MITDETVASEKDCSWTPRRTGAGALLSVGEYKSATGQSMLLSWHVEILDGGDVSTWLDADTDGPLSLALLYVSLAEKQRISGDLVTGLDREVPAAGRIPGRHLIFTDVAGEAPAFSLDVSGIAQSRDPYFDRYEIGADPANGHRFVHYHHYLTSSERPAGARRMMDARLRFIESPGFDPIQAASDWGLPILRTGRFQALFEDGAVRIFDESREITGPNGIGLHIAFPDGKVVGPKDLRWSARPFSKGEMRFLGRPWAGGRAEVDLIISAYGLGTVGLMAGAREFDPPVAGSLQLAVPLSPEYDRWQALESNGSFKPATSDRINNVYGGIASATSSSGFPSIVVSGRTRPLLRQPYLSEQDHAAGPALMAAWSVDRSSGSPSLILHTGRYPVALSPEPFLSSTIYLGVGIDDALPLLPSDCGVARISAGRLSALVDGGIKIFLDGDELTSEVGLWFGSEKDLAARSYKWPFALTSEQPGGLLAVYGSSVKGKGSVEISSNSGCLELAVRPKPLSDGGLVIGLLLNGDLNITYSDAMPSTFPEAIEIDRGRTKFWSLEKNGRVICGLAIESDPFESSVRRMDYTSGGEELHLWEMILRSAESAAVPPMFRLIFAPMR